VTTPVAVVDVVEPTRASTAGVATTTTAATSGVRTSAGTVAAAAAAGDGQPELAYTGAGSPVLPAGFALLLLLAGAGTLVLRRRH